MSINRQASEYCVKYTHMISVLRPPHAFNKRFTRTAILQDEMPTTRNTWLGISLSSNFLVLLLAFILTEDRVMASPNEYALHNALFTNYSKAVRPRLNYSESVEVEMSYILHAIRKLDELEQVLFPVGVFISKWRDDYLTWNPADYGGIESFMVTSESVWLPDLVIMNSANTFHHSTFTEDFQLRVQYTGIVSWTFGGQIATTCELDLTHFPLDTQICDIKLRTWKHIIEEVHLKAGNLWYKGGMAANGIWDMTNNTAEATVAVIREERITGVTFSLTLQRKPLYYVVSIVLPCLMILMVLLAVFWMPCEAGEKASVSITVLLAYTVFQIVIDSTTSRTSDYLPILSSVVLVTMIMATLSSIMSIIVLYLHHRGAQTRPPHWLRFLFVKNCAHVLCLNDIAPNVNNQVGDVVGSGSCPGPDAPDEECAISYVPNGKVSPRDIVTEQLAGIRTQMDVLTQFVKTREAEDVILAEWKALSIAVDRCFFWILLSLSVLLIPLLMAGKLIMG